MLNGQKVDIKVSDNNFSTIPSDKYTTQITDVNLKDQFNSFKQIEEQVLVFEFTILDNKTLEENGETESLRGRKLWKRTSLSLNTKSWLYKLASAALGHEMTKDEQEAFQPEMIIDKQVDVLVDVVDGTGKNAGNKYSNIVSFAKTTKELSAFENDKSAVGEPKESKPVAMDADEAEDFIKGLEEKDKSSK